MAIEAAVSGNWKEFYQKEIEYRKNMGYPPCIEYAVIELTGQDEKSVIEGAHNTADELRKYNVKILGPVPQIVSKVRDEYRWMITIKDTEAATVRKAVTETYFKMRDILEPAGVYLNPRIL